MGCFFLFIFTFLFVSSVLEAKKLTCNNITSKEPEIKFDVEFRLYGTNIENSKIIPSTKLKSFLNKRNFDVKNNTIVLVHGFTDAFDADWIKQMAKNLKAWDKTSNIIIVDWSDVSWEDGDRFPKINYREAALGTETTANAIYEMLKAIANASEKFSNWNHLHLIGHSLGAHVVGQAARFLKDREQFLVHRVTGLDPAFPCFENNRSSLRLRKEDAKFVDVIHTNSEPGKNPNLGTYEPIGHIDFYPNGGNNQPRCNETRRSGKTFDWIIESFNDALGYIAEIDVRPLTSNFLQNRGFNMLCDHGEAPKFFTDSLKRKDFWSNRIVKLPFKENKKLKCQNKKCTKNICIEMGMNAEKYNQKKYYGNYYVSTVNTVDC